MECKSLALAAEQRSVCSKGCRVLHCPRAEVAGAGLAWIGRKGTEDEGDDGEDLYDWETGKMNGWI